MSAEQSRRSDADTRRERAVRVAVMARRAPVRLATGAFVLHSGLDHVDPDERTAGEVHALASGTYPFLAAVDPRLFTRALGVAELVVGGLLLVPVVPAGVAGLALTGFAGGLVGLYVRTPGLRLRRSVFPTPQGLGFAKDAWLLAIGVSLVTDGVLASTPAAGDEEVRAR